MYASDSDDDIFEITSKSPKSSHSTSDDEIKTTDKKLDKLKLSESGKYLIWVLLSHDPQNRRIQMILKGTVTLLANQRTNRGLSSSKLYLSTYCSVPQRMKRRDLFASRFHFPNAAHVFRFGAKCYRKNPEHRKKYYHPKSSPKPSPKPKKEIPVCKLPVTTICDLMLKKL
jgi:hypothetical protein